MRKKILIETYDEERMFDNIKNLIIRKVYGLDKQQAREVGDWQFIIRDDGYIEGIYIWIDDIDQEFSVSEKLDIDFYLRGHTC